MRVMGIKVKHIIILILFGKIKKAEERFMSEINLQLIVKIYYNSLESIIQLIVKIQNQKINLLKIQIITTLNFQQHGLIGFHGIQKNQKEYIDFSILYFNGLKM